MPEDVQDTFGYALHQAQSGKKHEQAKPLNGFGSAGVVEVVEDSGSGTFRAVYTVKFGDERFMFCIAFKRNQRMAFQRQSLIWM